MTSNRYPWNPAMHIPPHAPVCGHSHTNVARLELLHLTLRHARSASPFYQSTLANLPVKLETIDDLAAFPFIDKDTLLERDSELQTIRRFPDYVMYTSGTSGSPLKVPVYREEIEAFEAIIVPELIKR